MNHICEICGFRWLEISDGCPACQARRLERENVTLKKRVVDLGARLSTLCDAARPFLSSNVVDETGGTAPLMDKLEDAIETAERG